MIKKISSGRMNGFLIAARILAVRPVMQPRLTIGPVRSPSFNYHRKLSRGMGKISSLFC